MSYLLGQMDATRIIGEALLNRAEKIAEGSAMEGSDHGAATGYMLFQLGVAMTEAAEMMDEMIRKSACSDGIDPAAPRTGPRAD